MKISDIISNGQISNEGIEKIEVLISENDRLITQNCDLIDAFAVKKSWCGPYPFYTVLTKKELGEHYMNINRISQELENKILEARKVLLSSNRRSLRKKLKKILE